MFVSAIRVIYWLNFSITGELLTYFWGKIGTQGYMSWVSCQGINMTLALRCNAKTHYMVVSTTHLVFCPNFSFTDELLTYLLSKIGAEGYISLGVMSRGKMALAHRCNAKSYSMFVSATHLMFYPNFSITNELLTYYCGKIGAQGYLSLADISRGNMTLALRCNAKSYSMFISATHLTSYPNFSNTGELLTYLWGKIGAQGYMSWGVMSRG